MTDASDDFHGFEGGVGTREQVKSYEQTQHLVESKESHFGQPSKCLRNKQVSQKDRKSVV